MSKPDKNAPKAERLRRKNFPVDKMISWWLIFIVSSVPFQSSIAMSFDMNAPVHDNQVLVTQHQKIVSRSGSVRLITAC